MDCLWTPAFSTQHCFATFAVVSKLLPRSYFINCGSIGVKEREHFRTRFSTFFKWADIAIIAHRSMNNHCFGRPRASCFHTFRASLNGIPSMAHFLMFLQSFTYPGHPFWTLCALFSTSFLICKMELTRNVKVGGATSKINLPPSFGPPLSH